MRNVARNMLRPGYLPEMCRKVATRLKERNAVREGAAASAWCRENPTDGEAWAESLDAKLWDEAKAMRDEQELLCKSRVDSLGFPLAGGGFYPMLYFLTRKFKKLESFASV